MSFIPFREKIKKKNWNLFNFRSDPESDPDPHQNKADPNHLFLVFPSYISFWEYKRASH